jgi:phenylacetate-CoA ligase
MGYADWMEKAYYRYRRYVPSRLLYDREHFFICGALEKGERDIAKLIEGRLRHILTTSITWVPYYRQSVRISPEELANEPPLELLTRFPFLEKAEIMEHQKKFLDERLRPEKLSYATSGGSTGQGIGLWRTKRLGDIEKAFFAHEWGKYGFSLDKSRYLRIGADARRLAHETPTRVVGNRLMLSPYHLDERFKVAIRNAINQYKPDFIHAYPSSAAALAELIDGNQLDLNVRAVLLASEPATKHQLAAIERAFKCPISVNYGLTERTNIAFAKYQDGQLGPYTFQNLYGVSENRSVDGRDEIVGTSLWNDVMPLVRYCTNDFGALDDESHCPTIEGRNQEFLIDRFGNRIPGLSIVIDEVTWDFVRFYQVRQIQAGRISIAVVPRSGHLTEEQASFILGAQLKRWGSFFDISLEQVEEIPLTAGGKRRLVVAGIGQ